MKKIFLTFGSESYTKSLDRISKQAHSMNIFDTILVYNETMLKEDTAFWETHGSFITSNVRGYGYWLWKSYIIYKTMMEADENTIVVYADAGCTLNPGGIVRLQSYFDIVASHPSGCISFELTESWCSEHRFTKMDLLAHFNAKHLLHTKQYSATVLILRKNEQSMNMVELWYKTCSTYHLIDDSPSEEQNEPTFIEHRHDQSIFSIIRKQYNTYVMTDEPDTGNGIPTIPIWTTRLRSS
jgi:hypothetical protein